MTAEIAVMNRGAIALAADSKVTITSGGISKTYDTVSKLFTLSKVAPVGIMIYGNADFMGYPWETIIKLYRKHKRTETESTIVDWSNDFFSFLSGFGKITVADKIANVEAICSTTLSAAIENWDEIARSDGFAVGTPEYEAGLEQHLKRRATNISEAEPWAAGAITGRLTKSFASPISDVIMAYVGGYSSEVRKQAIALLLGTLLLKVSSSQVTGVVIAGFGDDEYFPTLVEYRVDGYVGKKIKRYRVEPVSDISRSNPGCVRAFAQKEMVQRFMDGIDPYYAMFLHNAIPELVMDNCFQTLEQYGIGKYKTDIIRDKIREAVTQAVDGFEMEAKHYRIEKFSSPVVSMVSVLPKDELAHLAESLVALTSLKRRVSSDAETVGGPIDVALISKIDGFVWIKRKHYFDGEINKQFVANYMNDTKHGELNEKDSNGPPVARRNASERLPRGGKARAAQAQDSR